MCSIRCRRHSLMNNCCPHNTRAGIVGECGDGEPFDPLLACLNWGKDEAKRKEAMKRKAAPWLKWRR